MKFNLLLKSKAVLPLACALPLFLFFGREAAANDWPRWRGPNLDGISTETGWLKKWPADGPTRLWEAAVGIGYSSFAVSQGSVYTMGNVSENDVISCLDAETGKIKWKYEYPCSSKD